MEKQPGNTEWADLPLFKETALDQKKPLEEMDTDKLCAEYIRVFSQNPKYFTNGTKEEILFALQHPQNEESRIARQIIEENAIERANDHHA
jgi:uncharacterized membrane protein